MSVQERRKYDSDFKRNAVRLAEDPGRTVVDVAENLGISADLLYRWRREQRKKEGYAFPQIVAPCAFVAFSFDYNFHHCPRKQYAQIVFSTLTIPCTYKT